MLALGAMAIAGLTPMLAHAQFQLNKLYGKNFTEVSKMLGTPVEKTHGTPITYSRFKTPGAVDTIVWYFWNTGKVGKVQIQMLAKPGETEAEILKRYGISLGPNPRSFEVKAPAFEHVSVGAVPGMPWTKIFISYMYILPFQKEAMKYCKDNHLDPGKTYFWTIQVTTKKPPSRMIGATDTGSGTAKPKPTKSTKKGKKK